MARYIWLKVTDDVFELPVCVANSCHELARRCGVTPNAIYSCMAKAKRRGGGCIYQRIRVEKEEEDER